ncbi:MAG: molybdopterin-guanine dinucleotide biosynthesis protein MobB [Deltaproteobacteria bacterium]|nr:molybdopterin-guanine dinucleotide biosynthesis protein MobB [Deltaproteobacteria bacterium]
MAGPSGSGKTALICRLIKWFTARGLKVAVLKGPGCGPSLPHPAAGHPLSGG